MSHKKTNGYSPIHYAIYLIIILFIDLTTGRCRKDPAMVRKKLLKIELDDIVRSSGATTQVGSRVSTPIPPNQVT